MVEDRDPWMLWFVLCLFLGLFFIGLMGWGIIEAILWLRRN